MQRWNEPVEEDQRPQPGLIHVFASKWTGFEINNKMEFLIENIVFFFSTGFNKYLV